MVAIATGKLLTCNKPILSYAVCKNILKKKCFAEIKTCEKIFGGEVWFVALEFTITQKQLKLSISNKQGLF